MSANKTVKTDASVQDYMDAITPEARKADCEVLLAMMQEISGHPPKMWGASIVGFGEYHYKYESGREGDASRIGFSSRAQGIAIYIMPGAEQMKEEFSSLGKHKMGKSCLTIKRLSDINELTLVQIMQKSLDIMAEKYPE